MKRCPQCNRVETDEALKFCRVDGTTLVSDSGLIRGEAGTAKFAPAPVSSEIETSILPHTTDAGFSRATGATTVLPPPMPGTIGSLAKAKRRKTLMGVAIIAVAGIGAVISVLVLSNVSRKNSAAIDSIAVLPFENNSGNPDSDYLSDGLAESLIYRLSQLPNLKVSPTSSVRRYKGKEIDAQKIGAELGVNAVMSGRMIQRGNNLTISVELVDVRNNKSLWGERYDRKVPELLATQREIAAEIAQKLQLKLSGEETRGLTKHYTDNNEAYQLYLKGRYHYAKRGKDDILKGIDYFQQAIALDPNFALAYAMIADSYTVMPAFPYLSPKEASPQSKAAAMRALQLDPSLAEAHMALADSLATYDWNWVEAEREFRRALELDPNNSVTHFRYGLTYLAPLGRHDEAVAELKRAVELEPLSLAIGANLAAVYLFARQNNLALEQAKKTYDLEPNFVTGRYVLGYAYNANGMYAEGIALSEKSLQNDPTNQWLLRIAGYAYAKSDRRHEAEEIIRRYKEIGKKQYVPSYYVATIYAALGDKDKAFAELEDSFAARDRELQRLKIDPFMETLRDDSRFNDLVKRLGLPQ